MILREENEKKMRDDVRTTNSAATREGLRGVIAAIVTPLKGDGSPDAAAFCRVAHALLAGGCDGLNVLGTTGEATSFSLAERKGLMDAVAAERLPVQRMLVGTGAAAVGDAIALTRHARDLGFAGALVLPPFYYKHVAEDGVFDCLSAIIRSLGDQPFPIYLYNFPALSGVTYSVPLVRRLLEAFPHHISGLKDSSGDLPYARAIAAIDPRLAVYPSNEACLEEARTGVFAGCISATANVNAAHCAAAFHQGDNSALAKANAIRSSFNTFPLVAAVKLIMAHIHGAAELEAVKPPLTMLTPEQRPRMIAAYQQAARQE